jgi:hypothetical protein
MRRHDLQNEAEAQEDSPTPPAYGGEKVSGLPDSDQRVRRRAGSAKACRESATLAALQENGEDQHDAIDDEQYEKKVVKH